DYGAMLEDGSEPPPAVVFFDGTDYHLADGFHRGDAALKKGKASLKCEVRQGTQFDALLYGIQANSRHSGLRFTRADQRRAILLVVRHPEGARLPDSRVAALCLTTDKTVASVRREMEGRSEIPNVSHRTDTLGRQQPASKPSRPAAEPEPPDAEPEPPAA